MAAFHANTRPHNFQDLTGKRFNMLVVMRLSEINKRHHCVWECLCDCGKTSLVETANLKSGNSKSCGCLVASKLRTMRLTHGRSRTSEYGAWSRMISRCYDDNLSDFHRYGGRGIVVCDRWRYSFQAFLDDMGPRPSASHSIDRYPDNNGNYEPSNCRWATKCQQARNRRTNKVIEFNGESKTICEWAEHFNLRYHFLYQRLFRGWAFEEAVGLIARK